MSNHQDGGHVIPIFQGNNANNQDDDYRQGSATATPNPAYGGDEAVVTQILKSGSSTYGRPYKAPHCKAFNSEAGCPYGDNCVYIHDERVTTRESLAVVVAPGLCGTGAAAPLPLATSSGAMKPLFYRTKICNKWQQAGYCNYGSKCHFAHGEAELRKYSGRGPHESEASLNNQRAVVQNLPAATRPFPGSGVKAAAPANAGRTRQVAGAVQGPIPSKNAWKVPKKINGIYGDWIDGHEID